MNRKIFIFKRCLMAVVCLLFMDITPAWSQVQARRSDLPNEVRSGRKGTPEYSGGSNRRNGRGGAQYGRRRFENNLFGEEGSAGIWTIGLTAGTCINWQTREAGYAYDMSYKGRWGAAVGITATYQFFEWLSLRADVQYTQKNYEMRRMLPSLQQIDARTRFMQHYLQIPVMADWTFGSIVKSHIYTGGYGAFWAGGNVDRISIFSEKQQKAAYEFSSEDNRGEGGLVGGVGVSYDPLPYLRVGAEVLFYYSLSNTVKKQAVMNDTRYNNTVTFGVMATYIL